MTVRIGVAFDGFVTTAEAIALARQAVDAGASSLWMAEHLGYREAITTCAAFALSAPGPTLVPDRGQPVPVPSDADRDGARHPRRARARPRRGRARRRQSAVPPGVRAEAGEAAAGDARVHRGAAQAVDHRARPHGRRVRPARRRAACLQAATRSRSTWRRWGPTCCSSPAASPTASCCRPACRRIRCATRSISPRRAPARRGAIRRSLRRAGYIFFGTSNDAREADRYRAQASSPS